MAKKTKWYKRIFNWENLFIVLAIPLLIYAYNLIKPCIDWGCLGYVVIVVMCMYALIPFAILSLILDPQKLKNKILVYLSSIAIVVIITYLHTG